MKIAFDFDGTITKAPHIFKVLIKALKKNHSLYIITGTNVKDMNNLLIELQSYNIKPKWFKNIFYRDKPGNLDEVSKWKAKILDEHKIRLYFENRQETCQYLSELCNILKII